VLEAGDGFSASTLGLAVAMLIAFNSCRGHCRQGFAGTYVVQAIPGSLSLAARERASAGFTQTAMLFISCCPIPQLGLAIFIIATWFADWTRTSELRIAGIAIACAAVAFLFP